MIKVEGENVTVEGTLLSVLTDTTMVCGEVYRMIAKEVGQQSADEFFLVKLPQLIRPAQGDDAQWNG